jgi:hypothetical protein
MANTSNLDPLLTQSNTSLQQFISCNLPPAEHTGYTKLTNQQLVNIIRQKIDYKVIPISKKQFKKTSQKVIPKNT